MMTPKFRAYLVMQKKMVDVVAINFEEQIVLYHSGEKSWHGIDLETADFEKIHLIQSTGLHDKNGVEIFEGDVALLNDRYCVANTPIGGSPRFVRPDITELMIMVLHYAEVVSNIYENPELLEQQNG